MPIALTEKIAALAAPLLASLGLELWGLEFIPARRSVLRVYIEAAVGEGKAAGAAGIDECEQASRLLGLALDAEDIISSAYILEVSTPGLERILFTPVQLASRLGNRVEIHLAEAPQGFPGRKKFSGSLAEALPPAGHLPWRFRLRMQETDAGLPPADLDFAWPQVKKARLVHVWPEKTGGPGKNRGKQGRGRETAQKNQTPGQSGGK